MTCRRDLKYELCVDVSLLSQVSGFIIVIAFLFMFMFLKGVGSAVVIDTQRFLIFAFTACLCRDLNFQLVDFTEM